MASERDLVIEGLIRLQLEGAGADQAVATMKKIVEQARQVEQQVGGFGDKAKEGFDKASGAAGYFNKQLEEIGTTVASYFAASTLIDFLRDSYVGFAKAERIAGTTERQLRALGDAAGAENFKPFIQQLSRATGQMDDAIVPAFQRALTVTRDFSASQELVTKAAQFAAAGIGDVASNVEALTTFMQTGRAQALKPFVSDIKAGADGTLSLVEGFKQLNQTLSDIGTPEKDAAGRIEDLKIGFDEASKSVGGFIEKFLSVAQAFDTFSPLGTLLREGQDAREQAAVDLAFAQAQAQAIAGGKSKLDQQLEDRDAQRRKDSAEAELKAEQDLLNKKADLETKNQEDILNAEIAQQDKGSRERIDLELKLLDIQKAAALKAAEDLNQELKAKGLAGVNIAAIDKLFELQKSQKQLEFTPPKPTTALEEIDPAEQLKQIADFEQKRGEIVLEADKELAQLRLENSNNFEKDRIQAEADIQVQALEALSKKFKDSAELDAKVKEEIVKKLAARIKQIQEGVATAELDLDKKTQQEKLLLGLQVAGTFAQAALTLFANNKAVQVANAIINTAEQVTRVISIPPLAAAVAALGAAQIAKIISTNPGSGGSAASIGTIGDVATPTGPLVTVDQINAHAAPTIAAPSEITSGVSSTAGGGTTVNIRNAYGDKRAMRRLARDVNAALRYDPKTVK